MSDPDCSSLKCKIPKIKLKIEILSNKKVLNILDYYLLA